MAQYDLSKWKDSECCRNLSVGDTLLFGVYPCEEGQEPVPIEWEILRIENNQILALSVCGLDVLQYDPKKWIRDEKGRLRPLHGDEKNTDWKSCALRAWLNNDFRNKAFSENEQCLLAHVPHPSDGIDGDDYDTVFCLSQSEAYDYINRPGRGPRKSVDLTPLAHAKIRKEHAMEIDRCWNWYRGWWLRTVDKDGKPYCVVYNSALENITTNSKNDHQAVRPALLLDLNRITNEM